LLRIDKIGCHDQFCQHGLKILAGLFLYNLDAVRLCSKRFYQGLFQSVTSFLFYWFKSQVCSLVSVHLTSETDCTKSRTSRSLPVGIEECPESRAVFNLSPDKLRAWHPGLKIKRMPNMQGIPLHKERVYLFIFTFISWESVHHMGKSASHGKECITWESVHYTRDSSEMPRGCNILYNMRFLHREIRPGHL
jgi:hypothetical protein